MGLWWLLVSPAAMVVLGGYILFKLIKEKSEPTIPLENWSNKELIEKDRLKGISNEQFMKNLQQGKYKQTIKYPEPHRTEDGKILIENCELFEQDKRTYGAYKAYQFAEQGKYNLSLEEMENQRMK